jgi:hypothetical protein
MFLMTKHFRLQGAAWILALACGLPFASLAKDSNPPAKLKLDAASIPRDERTGHSYSTVVKKVTPQRGQHHLDPDAQNFEVPSSPFTGCSGLQSVFW